jgi:hypothetical protein
VIPRRSWCDVTCCCRVTHDSCVRVQVWEVVHKGGGYIAVILGIAGLFTGISAYGDEGVNVEYFRGMLTVWVAGGGLFFIGLAVRQLCAARSVAATVADASGQLGKPEVAASAPPADIVGVDSEAPADASGDSAGSHSTSIAPPPASSYGIPTRSQNSTSDRHRVVHKTLDVDIDAASDADAECAAVAVRRPSSTPRVAASGRRHHDASGYTFESELAADSQFGRVAGTSSDTAVGDVGGSPVQVAALTVAQAVGHGHGHGHGTDGDGHAVAMRAAPTSRQVRLPSVELSRPGPYRSQTTAHRSPAGSSDLSTPTRGKERRKRGPGGR